MVVRATTVRVFISAGHLDQTRIGPLARVGLPVFAVVELLLILARAHVFFHLRRCMTMALSLVRRTYDAKHFM